MRVLLTGGSGMVGRNILAHPLSAEFELLAPQHQELDLLDFNAVKTYLDHYKPHIIVHAAGYVGGIQANIQEPVQFLLANLDMGRNVVWAAYQSGVKQLLNLGSSCMYPRDAPNPLQEDYLLQGALEPTNEGYALAKIVVTQLGAAIRQQNPDYQYKTLIPCNLYGRYDKFDPQRAHLIAAIINKIHWALTHDETSVEIWGDGSARREFLYAADMADCVLTALQDFDNVPELMNVGLGTDYQIKEYYHLAAQVMGYAGAFHYNLNYPVGMPRKLVATTRAQQWGWQAQTPLEEGLARTYEYYLETLKSC